jgi:hypothetical protein
MQLESKVVDGVWCKETFNAIYNLHIMFDKFEINSNYMYLKIFKWGKRGKNGIFVKRYWGQNFEDELFDPNLTGIEFTISKNGASPQINFFSSWSWTIFRIILMTA